MSPRSPLDGIDLVLIDGNNLLHRRSGGVGDAPLRGLLVELQRVMPVHVRVQLMLDGHPAPGTPHRERVSQSLEIRHAGAQSADDALLSEVAAQPWAARARTIVVTDDRALTERSRSAGALARRLDWLSALPPAAGQSTGKPGTSIGAGRPPKRR